MDARTAPLSPLALWIFRVQQQIEVARTKPNRPADLCPRGRFRRPRNQTRKRRVYPNAEELHREHLEPPIPH
jgi:hypothetical protein